MNESRADLKKKAAQGNCATLYRNRKVAQLLHSLVRRSVAHGQRNL
jgi:hypothetical protein